MWTLIIGGGDQLVLTSGDRVATGLETIIGCSGELLGFAG